MKDENYYVGFQLAILAASKLFINIGKTNIMKCITHTIHHILHYVLVI